MLAALANVNTGLAAFNEALLCVRQVYRWTGDNMFFIKGDMDSLAFGGGRCVGNAEDCSPPAAATVLTLCFPSSAASSACGWTETSTTAGATPVRHSGTPCSQKRRISSCRTSKSGLLSNEAVHRWGQIHVLPQGRREESSSFRTVASSQT